MATHNDIEHLRKADTALREALRRKAEGLPQLPDDFVQSTLARLEAEESGAAFAHSGSESAAAAVSRRAGVAARMRNIGYRLWLTGLAVAAVLVAVVVMVREPDSGTLPEKGSAQSLVAEGNGQNGGNGSDGQTSGTSSTSKTSVTSKTSKTSKTSSTSSTSRTSKTRITKLTRQTRITRATNTSTPTDPPSQTDTSTPHPDSTSTSAPQFRIDSTRAEKLIARNSYSSNDYAVSSQQSANAKAKSIRNLALAVHYSANFQGRSGRGGADSDINNLQGQFHPPGNTDNYPPNIGIGQGGSNGHQGGSSGQGQGATGPQGGTGGNGQKGDKTDSTSVPTRSYLPTRSSQSSTSKPSGDYSHSLPFTLGISLRIPLSQRFSIETGLSYTYLRSKFTQYRCSSDQHIHYLGIPLSATANIVGNRHWKAYATAGVAIDFPIQAFRHGTHYTTIVPTNSYYGTRYISPPVQFSTGIGIGIQYDFNPHLGIYLQPSLQWFIPNGSDIETYRTEYPLQFALPLGLRITL